MRLWVLNTASLCAGLCLMPAHAADLKITPQFTSNGHSSTTTKYVKGQRSRLEWRNACGRSARPGDPVNWSSGPPRAVIYQCDARHVLQLDLDAGEYTSTRLNDQGFPEGVKPGAVAVQQKPSGGILSITIETIDTGERRQMFGHTARHIIVRDKRVAGPGACSQSSESEQDGWYIDLDFTDGCFRFPRKPAIGEWALILSTSACSDKIEFHRSGIEETGYPLEITTTSRALRSPLDDTSTASISTNVTRVTELVEAPLDSALFEIPSGFKRVLRLKGETTLPFGTRLNLAWQWFKDDVSALFR